MNFQPFNQPPPALGNQYLEDRVLTSYMRRTLPPEILRDIEPALGELGALSGGDLYQMQLADRLNHPSPIGRGGAEGSNGRYPR